jgi:hypothetical protein
MTNRAALSIGLPALVRQRQSRCAWQFMKDMVYLLLLVWACQLARPTYKRMSIGVKAGETFTYRNRWQAPGKRMPRSGESPDATVLMTRWEARTAVGASTSFGFSFEHHTTGSVPGCEEGTGHHRIVTYVRHAAG